MKFLECTTYFTSFGFARVQRIRQQQQLQTTVNMKNRVYIIMSLWRLDTKEIIIHCHLPYRYIIWCRVHRCIHQRGHTWTLSLSLLFVITENIIIFLRLIDIDPFVWYVGRTNLVRSLWQKRTGKRWKIRTHNSLWLCTVFCFQLARVRCFIFFSLCFSGFCFERRGDASKHIVEIELFILFIIFIWFLHLCLALVSLRDPFLSLRCSHHCRCADVGAGEWKSESEPRNAMKLK